MWGMARVSERSWMVRLLRAGWCAICGCGGGPDTVMAYNVAGDPTKQDFIQFRFYWN